MRPSARWRGCSAGAVWGLRLAAHRFAPDALPAYASTWEPVVRALTAAKKNQCAWEQAPATLYG